MDDDQLQLEPVPLLREQDRIKVALGGYEHIGSSGEGWGFVG